MNLKLDSTGDLEIKGGKLLLVSGPEEVRQRLEVYLNNDQGEWFLDATYFLPWRALVFNKGPDLLAIETLFKQAISTRPGVRRLLSYNQAYNDIDRSLSVNFKVEYDDGQQESLAARFNPEASAGAFVINIRRSR